ARSRLAKRPTGFASCSARGGTRIGKARVKACATIPARMPGASWRFGPFVADRTGYRVLREGRAIDVTPKLLDLLFHLVDHAGDLVTKEALLDALWPGANVTENALAQAVSELRQALGDDAASPRFIKTVARRGYRFIAPIERIESGAGAGSGAERLEKGNRTIAVMDFAKVSREADAAWLSAGPSETG